MLLGALGMDCARLGIGMTNKSTASSPTLGEDSQNQGKFVLVTWTCGPLGFLNNMKYGNITLATLFYGNLIVK